MGSLFMQAHAHDHHHGPVEIPPSLLRLSALQRIAIAALLSALLWGAVIWAIV
jgi:hypothetical protein